MQDIGDGRYPRALMVAVVSWSLLAVTLMVSRVGAPQQTDAEATDAATGVTAVRAPSGQQQWFVDLLPWLGVVALVFALLLLVGHGWTRLALALLGVLAVVGLAQAQPWLTIPAAVFLVIGAVCSLLVSSHRYLTQPRADAPATTEVGPS